MCGVCRRRSKKFDVTELLPQYAELLPVIRKTARELGYAIGLHGSGQRDMDLIAFPWVEWAAAPAELMDAICRAVDGYIARHDQGHVPEHKPHGRLAWSIYIDSKGRYIDLSVAPRGNFRF